MKSNYKRIYFHLVGKVSNIIDAMDLMCAAGAANDPKEILQMTREGLKAALLEAEEMYIEQEEQDEGDRL